MAAKPRYRVKDVAALAGVTVRTLHHYDAIGLLVPSARSGTGYRLYSDADLLRLQQILIGRTLGMPLESIRRMLDDPEHDRRAALLTQREQLARRVERAEAMLRAVDEALAALDSKGDDQMNHEKLFDGFDPSAYEEEVEQRWGNTEAYAESRRRTKRYTDADWREIKAESEEIMSALAERMKAGLDPSSPESVALAERHRQHTERWFYPCSPAMHRGLADMYEADERFQQAFERHAEGLCEYLVAAIRSNRAHEHDAPGEAG